MDEPEEFFSRGDGPVLPLYVTHEECSALWVAISTLLVIDQAVANDVGLATDEDMMRADRLRMASRRRQAVLMSLQTALSELAGSLGRTEDGA